MVRRRLSAQENRDKRNIYLFRQECKAIDRMFEELRQNLEQFQDKSGIDVRLLRLHSSDAQFDLYDDLFRLTCYRDMREMRRQFVHQENLSKDNLRQIIQYHPLVNSRNR